MKKSYKLLAVLLAAALLAAFLPGCIKINIPEQPTETAAPTAAPTSAPTAAPTEEIIPVDGSLIGDWYGVMSISEAKGKYAANEGVRNDCALRIGIPEGNRAPAALLVNNVGELIHSCEAEVLADGFMLRGIVGGAEVAWKLVVMGKKLLLSETYGVGEDSMLVDIYLRHCGDEFDPFEGPTPEGYEFTQLYGFGNVIEAFGGTKDSLPVIEKEGVNVRYTADEYVGPVEPEAAAFDDEGRTISANGVFSLVVPEGFKVTRDDDYAISFENKKLGVEEVIFYLYLSEDDPYETLLENEAGTFGGVFYHYTIDGFDCYAIVHERGYELDGSEIYLLGSDGSHFFEAHYVIGGTPEDLHDMLANDSEAFETLVLGALLRPENIVTD